MPNEGTLTRSNTYNPGWKDHPNFSYKRNYFYFISNFVTATPPGSKDNKMLMLPKSPNSRC